MKLSLMTLGCPEWDLETICVKAGRFGFDGIDFRGLQHVLDVTTLPAFTSNAAQTAKLLSDNGLVTSGISSSIHVCSADRRTQSMEEARRTLAAAIGVGATNIRVFGEGRPTEIGYPEAAKIGSDCIHSILELPGARSVSWNFETHDHWISSAHCRLLLDAIPDPALGVAWDLGHTRRLGGESAQETLDALGDRVRYVHIKDAIHNPSHVRAMTDGWRYVLPGTGELQLKTGVELLRQRGYGGWLMFEHEKRWHPELEVPDIAFPAFVDWVKPLLA